MMSSEDEWASFASPTVEEVVRRSSMSEKSRRPLAGCSSCDLLDLRFRFFDNLQRFRVFSTPEPLDIPTLAIK